MRGMASGTRKGSRSSCNKVWFSLTRGGKIIFKQIRNKIIPPAICIVSFPTCKKFINPSPMNVKMIMTTKAINISRQITIFCRFGSRSLSNVMYNGIFPIGSIRRKREKAIDKKATKASCHPDNTKKSLFSQSDSRCALFS